MTKPRQEQARAIRFKIIHAHPWLAAAGAVLLAVTGVLAAFGMQPAMALLLGFDAAALLYLGSTAWAFAHATPASMRRNANEQDVGRWGVLWTSVGLTCVVLLALGVELGSTQWGGPGAIAVGASSIMLSWLYMNTTFATHYAHSYYGSNGAARHGLDFPGDDEPDYWDFAYFALVLGMTFQVSDVQITSRHLRRMALMHSVIAFFMNVFIIAVTVNIVAGQA